MARSNLARAPGDGRAPGSSLTAVEAAPASPEELLAHARRLAQPVERSADGRLVIEAATVLPTSDGPFDLRLFHFDGGPEEHLALSVGDVGGPEPLLVRVHSECLTSEVLGSLKCDCADQLSFALRAVQEAGRGMVVYLRQEGRGIGLANKLRAYALQRLGADTVDANRLLGLPDDARDYGAAAALFTHLGVRSVRLLTNNPAKSQALEAHGIAVAGMLPVLVACHPLAKAYLETKRERMAHRVP